MNAKLDFVSVFGLNYIAALCAGVDWVFGSRLNGSTILAGLGQVTGQCESPGVLPGFVAFAHVLLLLLGRESATLESVGFCVLCVVYLITLS